ncbi:hypothetical protein WJU23_20870 [Prosthecobacter sp. SYSU 5D2]|uniref:hypothetical protein n=1 Tax=Prosthecobacter sp. SYSU 5D2 TaxID=3134134 RepID=UPI0031FE92F1
MKLPFQMPAPRRGSLLVEVSLAMGLTALVALVLMRASLLAISGNQWTVMQTLTDAYLTRETALANRLPFADVTGEASAWPAANLDSEDVVVDEQTVTLGRLAGGTAVQGVIRRFRTQEAAPVSEVSQAVWRLHSILAYNIGDEQYTKSRSVLRVQ